MSRYIPHHYTEHLQETRIQQQIQSEKELKKEKAKQNAIDRAEKRKQLLESFCKKYKVDIQGELCGAIKKIFRDVSTKNITLASYKQELDIIGSAINKVGLDFVTLKIVSNATRKYKHLVYDGQLEKGFWNNSKSGVKDNAKELTKDKKTTKTANLSDFDAYRSYLSNPNDDGELKKFVEKEFGLTVK